MYYKALHMSYYKALHMSLQQSAIPYANDSSRQGLHKLFSMRFDCETFAVVRCAMMSSMNQVQSIMCLGEESAHLSCA